MEHEHRNRLRLLDRRLRDAYLHRSRVGSLVFPSSLARGRGRGGYRCEDCKAEVADEDLFPALVVFNELNEGNVVLVTPSGVHSLSRYCLVGVEKEW